MSYYHIDQDAYVPTIHAAKSA